jgi:hypothetical protein
MPSVEDRLRQSLQANAAVFTPEPEIALDPVLRRGRADRYRRWAVRVVLAAALVVGVALTGVHLLTGRQGAETPARQPTPAGALGVLERDVALEAAPEPTAAGVWRLDFRTSGALVVTPPASYGGVVSGVTFRSEADGIHLDLFGQDLCSGLGAAVYRVDAKDGGVLLVPVDEPCAARRAVLASGSWEEKP